MDLLWERPKRLRREIVFHWFLFLPLYTGLPGGVVRLLCPAWDGYKLKSCLYLRGKDRNTLIHLGESVDGGLELGVCGGVIFHEDALITTSQHLTWVRWLHLLQEDNILLLHRFLLQTRLVQEVVLIRD